LTRLFGYAVVDTLLRRSGDPNAVRFALFEIVVERPAQVVFLLITQRVRRVLLEDLFVPKLIEDPAAVQD
jgi:hypothetical protein